MNHRAFETAIEKIARICSREFGVNVQFGGSSACTNGKTIYLPQIDKLNEHTERITHGFVDHETAHVIHTDFSVKDFINDFHKDLSNVIEDARVERLISQRFPGAKSNLSYLNAFFRNKLSHAELPDTEKLLLEISDALNNKWSDNPTLAKIRDLVSSANSCTNTREVVDVAKAILERLKADEKIEQKKEENKENKESKAENEGDNQDKPEAKKSSESDAGGSTQETKAQEPSEYDTHKPIKTTTDMVNDELQKAIKQEEREIPQNTIEETSFSGAPKHRPFTTEFDEMINHSGKGNPDQYARIKKDINPLISPIRQHLERTLVAKANRRWLVDQDRGKLNSRQLTRLIVGNSPRVFRKKTEIETKNVAVSLLIDLSGSMIGSKIDTAQKSATALAEALTSINIPFEILGFHSEHDSRIENKFLSAQSAGQTKDVTFNRCREIVNYPIFKSFDTTKLNGLTKIKAGNNNTDGEAVLFAAKRLAERREARRILIVLSDGLPEAEGDRSILCNDLKQKVNLCEANGLEVFAIGIESTSVKSFYKNYCTIEDVKDLPTKLLKSLEKLLVAKHTRLV